MAIQLKDFSNEFLISMLAEAIESHNAPGYNVENILTELFRRRAAEPSQPEGIERSK